MSRGNKRSGHLIHVAGAHNQHHVAGLNVCRKHFKGRIQVRRVMGGRQGGRQIPRGNAKIPRFPAGDVVYFEGHDWLSGYLKDAIFPKYMKAVPTVKGLITHDDVNRLYVGILPEDFDGNKSSAVIVLEWTGGFIDPAPNDKPGWTYTSAGEGTFWIRCTHTDTKNNAITSW